MNKVIYFDSDGVLADFTGGALALHGKELPAADIRWDFMTQIGFAANDPAFWGPMENAHFWRNMAPLRDGMRLFQLVADRYGKESVSILSSASVRCSADGKRDWLERHLPDHKRCAIFATEKHRMAAPCKVLIDDFEKNVDAFFEKGGVAVLVPRPWNRRRNECVDGWWFDVNQVFDEVVFATEYGISNIWEK